MTLTIGRLARKYGLSRSTLLYYDSIGLLLPSSHVKGEYRIYNENDEKRLELICRYRKAGLPLKTIAKILDSPETSFTAILHQRFKELNNEVLQLYEQQRVIADLLQNTDILHDSEVMTEERWVSILKASGYSEEEMRRWHISFERNDSEKHSIFLKFLQLTDEEIEKIKSWANE